MSEAAHVVAGRCATMTAPVRFDAFGLKACSCAIELFSHPLDFERINFGPIVRLDPPHFTTCKPLLEMTPQSEAKFG
jgi:hypothetical protein